MNSLYWQTALLLAGAYLAGAILSCLVRKLFPSDRRSDYDANASASVPAESPGMVAPSTVPSPQAGATLATHNRAGEEIVTISHGLDQRPATPDTSYMASDGRVVEPPAQRASLSSAEISNRSPSLSSEIAASERAKQFERSLSGEAMRPAAVDQPIPPAPSAVPEIVVPSTAIAAGQDAGQLSGSQVAGSSVVADAALATAGALAAAAATAGNTAEAEIAADRVPPEAVVSEVEPAAEIDIAAVPATDAVLPIAPVAVAERSAAPGPDDLKNIRAIDAGIEQELNASGITRYSEIASWTTSNVDDANAALGTTGRVQKENWIEQAEILSTGSSTAYSRRRQIQSAGQSEVQSGARTGAQTGAMSSGGTVPTPAPVAAPEPAATAVPAVAPSTAATAVPIVSSAAAAPQPVAASPAVTATAVAAPELARTGIGIGTSAGDEGIEETRSSSSLAATAAKAAAAVAGAAAMARSSRSSSAQEPGDPEAVATKPAEPMSHLREPAVQDATDATATPSGDESAPPQSDSTSSANGGQTTINPIVAAAAAATVAAVTGPQQQEPTAPDPQIETQPQSKVRARADREPWPERQARPEPKPRQARSEREPRESRQARSEREPRERRTSLQGMRSVRSQAYRGSAASASSISSSRVLSSEYDDLKRVRGIGVMIERRLNALGITSYEQIANWSADDVARISQALEFKGRIERENWIEQARILGAGGYTEFSSRVDRGEVDSSKDRR